MATIISYQKKGPRFLLGRATDWVYVEEAYSAERFETLKRMESYGAIRNITVK